MRWLLCGLIALGACGKKTPPEAAPPDAVVAAPAETKAAAPEDAKAAAPEDGKAAAPEDAKAAAPEDAKAAATDDAIAAATPDATPEADADALPPEAWTLTPPVAMPAPTPTTGACIPDLLGSDWVDEAGAKGRAITLCRYQNDKPACWSLDVDSGAVATTKVPTAYRERFSEKAAVVSPKGLKIARDGKSAKACDGPCVALDLGGVPVMAGEGGVANGRAFLLSASDEEHTPIPDGVALRVYDAKSGALLWKKTYGELESDCPLATWTGDTLYAELGVCAGPGAIGVFFDGATGARLGVLGGGKESASAWAVTPVPLPSGAIALREQYGHAIFFHDPKTSALTGQMNLSGGIAKNEYGLATSAEEGWMVGVARADGKLDLVVGHGDASRDRVMVVDPEARTVTHLYQLQACAP